MAIFHCYVSSPEGKCHHWTSPNHEVSHWLIAIQRWCPIAPKWDIYQSLYLCICSPEIAGFFLSHGKSHMIFRDIWMIPSGNLLHSYWKWPIEIVDLPNLKMVIFSIVFCMFTRPGIWRYLPCQVTWLGHSMGWGMVNIIISPPFQNPWYINGSL